MIDMKAFQDFREFLEEYRVIGLAVAFVIGMAVNDFVQATVDDIFMPVVGIFLPGGEWETATWTFYGANFEIGHFLGALLDFLVIALLIFIFVRYILGKEKIEK